VGGLDPAEREPIVDALYAIFGTYFAGHDRDTFARIALPTPETRFALLYALDGTLGGFASNTIQRLAIDGRVHAAMGGSAFVRPEYRGGPLAGAYTLSEVLRFRLRHPRVPIGFLGAVLGPTTYQRFAQTFERVYPNRRDGFPAEIARIVRPFAEARQLAPEGAPPWVVDLGVTSRRSPSLTGERGRDPDVRYFCAQNPDYLAGRALLTWIPLDAANLRQAFRSLGGDLRRGALSRWRARADAPPPRR
jgi:hypothetical protein